jgi:DNA-directed RNA polymerase subunit RPC12/RpoP
MDSGPQPVAVVCAECGREPREDENAADEWRAYRDISDELPVFCPECAEREFSQPE